MSGFGYSNLRKEVNSPYGSQTPWNFKFTQTSMKTSVTRTTMNPLEIEQSENTGNIVRKPKSKQENASAMRSKSESKRYTALRPTSVRELSDRDVEGDGDVTSSRANLTVKDRKRISISKVNVIICGLLIACVVLVAFTVIYVFIILPAYDGSVLYPDGKTHSVNSLKNVEKNVVMTSCGYVRGREEHGAYVFKGIPYALPPTGSRRWRAPVPRTSDTDSCWQGVYNAFHYGSNCAQPKFDNTSAIYGNEDCLYINVWTPSLSQISLLPVMVWFHSGDLVYGQGHMPGMSPTPEISVATNSVYVSFNYRLGAFGFLALDELREEQRGAAGNYGFMDQQLALTWVQENIRFFGGDQYKVTIFGHGSGATSVHAMLSSAKSVGLFYKAWLTSPVAILNKTIDDACRDNSIFLKTTGCRDAHCLRKLPPDVVSRSSPWPLQPHWTLDHLFSAPFNSQIRNGLPIFDGHVLHLSSQKSGPDGPVVPVVFGSTFFDLSSLSSEERVVSMTWSEYDDEMAKLAKFIGIDAANEAKSLYSKRNNLTNTNPSHFPSTPSVQFTHIIGDIKDTCPVKILSDNFLYLYSGSSPVYMYVVESYPFHNMKFAGGESNSFVGWDMAAFFDGFQDLGFDIGQGEVNFQNILQEEIMSFVKTGQPSASRWNTADKNIGIFSHDVTVTPVTSEYFNKCDFWKQHEYFKYTWNKSE